MHYAAIILFSEYNTVNGTGFISRQVASVRINYLSLFLLENFIRKTVLFLFAVDHIATILVSNFIYCINQVFSSWILAKLWEKVKNMLTKLIK